MDNGQWTMDNGQWIRNYKNKQQNNKQGNNFKTQKTPKSNSKELPTKRETINEKPETRNERQKTKPQTINTKRETNNEKQETRDKKLITRNKKPETTNGNPKPQTPNGKVSKKNREKILYAIVDIETTGGHASANAITEIAVYIHDGENIVDHFKTLINPERKIPFYITALTGISNAMVASAPVFAEVAQKIYEMLAGKIFVAHNVNFDFSFIRHYLKLNGYDLNVKKLCTVRLSRKVFQGMPSYSLGNLCRNLCIIIEDRHRADGDAKATAALFDKILGNGGILHINAMLKRSSGEQWLPLNMEKSQLQQLPSCPGVYYFHDAKGKIIYVGKAINIRKRVSSHFTHNDVEKRRQHFLRQVCKVTHAVCANELQALVLESTEIKKHWPKYNYSQKQPDRKFGLYCFEDNRGYMRLAIDKKKINFPAAYLFNSLHEGLVLLKKMLDEFDLDQKLCYLDKTPFAETDFQLLDPPAGYNKKVSASLEALQKQLPTFAIVDDGIREQEKLYLLVERGNFCGMGYLPSSQKIQALSDLKDQLEPYPDNDFIRNSIYAFAEANPTKKILLQAP